MCSQDVPPFMTVDGNPLAVHGINRRPARRGFSAEAHRAGQADAPLLYRRA
jgi:UDP-N-acetylglucosamine acyltransferase